MSQFFTACGKSFMYKRKRRGPNIESCGTPHFKSAGSEYAVSTLTQKKNYLRDMI